MAYYSKYLIFKVVTAIREFLQALQIYKKIIHLNEQDRSNLNDLESQITAMEELKNLFLVLLRQYKPNLQSKQYLKDLIITNHNYLLLLDSTTDDKTQTLEHLKE